jgi:hypothetical protein
MPEGVFFVSAALLVLIARFAQRMRPHGGYRGPFLILFPDDDIRSNP